MSLVASGEGGLAGCLWCINKDRPQRSHQIRLSATHYLKGSLYLSLSFSLYILDTCATVIVLGQSICGHAATSNQNP